MSRKSPRVTRQQHNGYDNSGDESDIPNTSRSSAARQHDSSFATPGKRTDNSCDSSILSDSLGSAEKSSRLYPDISRDMNQSGDFQLSPKQRKMREVYPNLETVANRGESQKRNTYQESMELSPNRGTRREGGNPSDKTSTNSSCLLVVVCVVVVIAAAVVLFMKQPTPAATKPPSSKSGFELFQEELQVLRHAFPNQTKRFWNTISASARQVFYPRDPCFPSVILIASHAKHKSLNSCLAKKVATVFSNSQGGATQSTSLDTDVEDMQHLQPSQQKESLDETLNLAFTKAGKKSMVISNVHALAPEAALLLHGFCDGDNAPFRDVMIVLTFVVDDSIEFRSVKQVETTLTHIWQHGLHIDKLAALMSRIANNPVVVMGEQDAVERNMC